MVISNKDILDAVNRVSEQVTRVDAKADRTNVRLDTVVIRMDTLVDTTNHRMDAFTNAFGLKADKTELLTSMGFHLMNNKAVRWGLGIAIAAITATATFEHWWSALIGLFGG